MSEEERPVPRTRDFVETLAFAAIVGFTDHRMFVIEFLRPETNVVMDKEGKFKGFRGALFSAARIYVPPVVAKRLLKALSTQIKSYEEKFGEIKEEG
ncbi:MAG: DUF3467 domain-containing protein [Candidatus Freyarchaeota archaeon]